MIIFDKATVRSETDNTKAPPNAPLHIPAKPLDVLRLSLDVYLRGRGGDKQEVVTRGSVTHALTADPLANLPLSPPPFRFRLDVLELFLQYHTYDTICKNVSIIFKSFPKGGGKSKLNTQVGVPKIPAPSTLQCPLLPPQTPSQSSKKIATLSPSKNRVACAFFKTWIFGQHY